MSCSHCGAPILGDNIGYRACVICGRDPDQFARFPDEEEEFGSAAVSVGIRGGVVAADGKGRRRRSPMSHGVAL